LQNVTYDYSYKLTMQQGTLKINDTVKWLSLFEKPFDNEAPVIGRHRDYYTE